MLNFIRTVAQEFDKVDITPLPHANPNGDYLQLILTVVFGLLGILSLFFVTVGGFRYVASQGDPQAAAKAKGTITYAVIGLLVSISAVSIVTFFLGNL